MEESGHNGLVNYSKGEEIDSNDLKVYGNFECEHILKSKADFIQNSIKFDLIVASWTIFHLCDPFGCVIQLYELLSKNGGRFICNKFYG
jgi:hypothetical protein